MPLDLGWDVVKDVVTWATAAHSAAKDWAEHRIGNVVEHAGVLVAGTNKLNSVVVQLLRPLAYFDPQEWGLEERRNLVHNLVLFVEESVVVPRMRVARQLRTLLPDLDDRDVVLPAGLILQFADFLFTPPSARYSQYPSDETETLPNTETSTHHVTALDSASYVYDQWLTESLPPPPRLTYLIRNAQTSAEVAELRGLAEMLTSLPDGTRGTMHMLESVDPSLRSAIGELVVDSREIFRKSASAKRYGASCRRHAVGLWATHSCAATRFSCFAAPDMGLLALLQ